MRFDWAFIALVSGIWTGVSSPVYGEETPPSPFEFKPLTHVEGNTVPPAVIPAHPTAPRSYTHPSDPTIPFQKTNGPTIQDFCRDPYTICKNYKPAKGRKPPYIPRTFFPQKEPQRVRAGAARVRSFFQNELKPAMIRAVQNSPGLSRLEKMRGANIVNALSLTVTNDRMRCQGVGTINAMALVGQNRILLCEGMLNQAIQNSLEKNRPMEGFLAHTLGHEIGHFLEASLKRVNQALIPCLDRFSPRGSPSGHHSTEKIPDFWGNQALYEISVKKQFESERALAALEDAFSNFCVFPKQGYDGHPPIPNRIATGRYSSLAKLLPCPRETDTMPYCTTVGLKTLREKR